MADGQGPRTANTPREVAITRCRLADPSGKDPGGPGVAIDPHDEGEYLNETRGTTVTEARRTDIALGSSDGEYPRHDPALAIGTDPLW